MTIPELAKEFECDLSSLRKKFKRYKGKLEGHYKIINNVILLDDYAAEIIMPSNVKIKKLTNRLKNAEDYNEVYSKKQFDAENREAEYNKLIDELVEAKTKASAEKLRADNAEEHIKKLEELLSEQKAEKHEMENIINKLNDKISEYEKMICELKSKKSIFKK